MDREYILNLRDRYKSAGFTPFPLANNSKSPPKGSCLDTIDTEFHFKSDSNIGLFPGSPNGLIVADADNSQSKKNLTAGFKNMGLLNETAIVLTPEKQGYHFWLKVINVPNNLQTFYYLPRSVGAGEIRIHRNIYVLAPGSVLPEGEYKFIQGSIESFQYQPIVEWKDLLWLLPDNAQPSKQNFEDGILDIPVRLIYRPSPKVLYYLHYLCSADRGTQIPKINFSTGEILNEFYPSRSEAESALVTGLILNGWSFENIYELFEKESPGHYAESANPEEYLINTYNKAVQYLTSSDKSYQIGVAYRFTLFNAWPGRKGEYNQKVMSAILSKAWQFNTFTPSISLREISEFTAIKRLPTIIEVLKRLQRDKDIKIMGKTSYKTSQFNVESYIENINNCNINHIDNIEYPVSTVPVIEYSPFYASEIWSRNKGMLGGSANMIYTHLSDAPIKINQLKKLTGKCWNTVNSNMNKLIGYELAISTDYGYLRGNRSVESVAEELQAKMQYMNRLDKHRLERELYKNKRCKTYI